MKTLRKAVGLSVLFVLLFLTACGGAAAPLQPKRLPDRTMKMNMKRLPRKPPPPKRPQWKLPCTRQPNQ